MVTDLKNVFTIGHSNHAIEKFLALLKANNIELVVDIRSRPYSRYASQFNRAAVQEALHSSGIAYLYLGDKLGGRPLDERFYDSEGNVVLSRISETPEFHDGIYMVVKSANGRRATLMCSEENPFNCHRFHLVSGFLEKKGVEVIHIRGDGRLQLGKELTLENLKNQKQLSLFGQL